jgi:hypothetical protein
MSCKMSNRIGNVMIRVFVFSGIAVDRGFNSMLVVIFGGRVKPKSISNISRVWLSCLGPLLSPRQRSCEGK